MNGRIDPIPTEGVESARISVTGVNAVKAYATALFTLLTLAIGSARSEDNKLPAEAATILAKATELELYSIVPSFTKSDAKDAFRGYEVLGKTTVKGAGKKDLVAAFKKGLDGQIDPAACFNPRHGIRATYDGKSVDLVICFECAQFKVFLDKGDKGTGLLINAKPQVAFDKVLKDAGIEKAK